MVREEELEVQKLFIVQLLQGWDTMQTMAGTKPLKLRVSVNFGQLISPSLFSGWLHSLIPSSCVRVTVSIATKLPVKLMWE